MRRRLVATLLSLFMVIGMLPMHLYADYATQFVFCGNYYAAQPGQNEYYLSYNPTANQYHRFSEVGVNDNWQVAFMLDDENREYTMVLRNLSCDLGSYRLLEMWSVTQSDKITLKCIGDNVITASRFIDGSINITIIGEDTEGKNASLKLVPPADATDDIYPIDVHGLTIDNIDLEATAKNNAGVIQSNEAGLVINNSNLKLKSDGPDDQFCSGIQETFGPLTITNSTIDIITGDSSITPTTEGQEDFAIECLDADISNSKISIEMNTPGEKSYGLSKTSLLGCADDRTTLNAEGSEISVKIADGSVCAYGIKNDTINAVDSKLTVDIGSALSEINGISCREMNATDGTDVDVTVGNASQAYALIVDSNPEDSVLPNLCIKESTVTATCGSITSELNGMICAISDNGECSITQSTIEANTYGKSPAVAYGMLLIGNDIDFEDSAVNVNVVAPDSSVQTLGIGFTDIPSFDGENSVNINCSCNNAANTFGIQFSCQRDLDFFMFSDLGEFNITSTGYGIDFIESEVEEFLIGDHASYCFDCGADIILGNVIARTYPGYRGVICAGDNKASAAPVDAGDLTGISSDKYFTVNPTHIFSDCMDYTCDYDGCNYERSDPGHQYEAGSDVCSECGYIKKIEISGLDAPVATKALDTEISNSSPNEVFAYLEWDTEDKNADYDTVYTVTVNVKIDVNSSIDDNTTCILDGNEVELTEKLLENNLYYVKKTFDKTAEAPSPTPTNGPTPTEPPTTPTPTEPPTTPTPTEPPMTPTPTEPPMTPTPTEAPTTPTPTPKPTATIAPTPTPKLGVGDFVTRCYRVALSREPDPAGYEYWVDSLNNGQACGAQVGYGFIFSSEYIEKNTSNEQYVNDLYAMYFGRKPDEGGFKYWLDQLNDGVTREEVFAGFANSQEFYNLCMDYGVVSGMYLVGVPNDMQGGINCFVARLYKVCLNRLPDITGQAGWVLKLRNGEVSGSTCAYGFVFSPEFMNLGLNDTDFVCYMYRAFFGREADEEGLEYWVSRLQDGTDTREDVFRGFSGSLEFMNLCAGYGIEV